MSSRVRLFRGREAQEKTGLTNVQDGFEGGVKAALFFVPENAEDFQSVCECRKPSACLTQYISFIYFIYFIISRSKNRSTMRVTENLY